MSYTTRSSRGVATLVLIAYLAIAAVVTYGAYEVKQIFSPNTHKAEITQADTQAQDAAKAALVAKEASDKLATDSQAALAKQTAVAQAAAGSATGAKIAIDAEQAPTVGVKVASKLIDDTVDTLPPATAAQIATFQAIVTEMKANNAQLNKSLLEQEAIATQAQQDAATAKAQAQASAVQAKADHEDALAKANQVAATNANLDGKTAENKTLWDRLKAIGVSATLLFVLIPLIALAFPGTVPVIKVICAPLLGIWHLVHAREKAIVTKLGQDIQVEVTKLKTQLEAEVNAHSATKNLLVSVASKVTSVATTVLPPAPSVAPSITVTPVV
jgi:hypothetical protein